MWFGWIRSTFNKRTRSEEWISFSLWRHDSLSSLSLSMAFSYAKLSPASFSSASQWSSTRAYRILLRIIYQSTIVWCSRHITFFEEIWVWLRVVCDVLGGLKNENRKKNPYLFKSYSLAYQWDFGSRLHVHSRRHGFLIYIFFCFCCSQRSTDFCFCHFFWFTWLVFAHFIVKPYGESVVLHAAYHNNVLSLWVAATRVIAYGEAKKSL